MSLVKRWLGYVRTRLQLAMQPADRSRERREAEQEAERADDPWGAPPRGTRPAGRTAAEDFDLDVSEREAAERLGRIRDSLDSDGEGPRS